MKKDLNVFHISESDWYLVVQNREQCMEWVVCAISFTIRTSAAAVVL